MNDNVDTGLTLFGHPVLLGPTRLGHKADRCSLTRVDRFLKEYFLPSLGMDKYFLNHDGTMVKGAVPDEKYM